MDDSYSFYLGKIEENKNNTMRLNILINSIMDRPDMTIGQKEHLLKLIETYKRGTLL